MLWKLFFGNHPWNFTRQQRRKNLIKICHHEMYIRSVNEPHPTYNTKNSDGGWYLHISIPVFVLLDTDSRLKIYTSITVRLFLWTIKIIVTWCRGSKIWSLPPIPINVIVIRKALVGYIAITIKMLFTPNCDQFYRNRLPAVAPRVGFYLQSQSASP